MSAPRLDASGMVVMAGGVNSERFFSAITITPEGETLTINWKGRSGTRQRDFDS